MVHLWPYKKFEDLTLDDFVSLIIILKREEKILRKHLGGSFSYSSTHQVFCEEFKAFSD